MGLSHNVVQETYFLYHGNIQVLFLNLAKQPPRTWENYSNHATEGRKALMREERLTAVWTGRVTGHDLDLNPKVTALHQRGSSGLRQPRLSFTTLLRAARLSVCPSVRPSERTDDCIEPAPCRAARRSKVTLYWAGQTSGRGRRVWSCESQEGKTLSNITGWPPLTIAALVINKLSICRTRENTWNEKRKEKTKKTHQK